MSKIKKCTLADLEALHKISIETYQDTFEPFNTEKNMQAYLESAYNKPKLSRELQTKNMTFYFIYEETQLAGYLKVNIDEAQSEPMGAETLEVERIYIRPAFKRHGLGLQFINHAINLAQTAHKDAIWLGVWEHNYPAQAFYKQQGFKPFSSHIFVMGDDPQTDILMRKTLSK